MIKHKNVNVASVTPFWRYAVGPTSQHSPAVPFWSKSEALLFFIETQRTLPWAGSELYKRKGWRGIETISRYVPTVTDASPKGE